MAPEDLEGLNHEQLPTSTFGELTFVWDRAGCGETNLQGQETQQGHKGRLN